MAVAGLVEEEEGGGGGEESEEGEARGREGGGHGLKFDGKNYQRKIGSGICSSHLIASNSGVLRGFATQYCTFFSFFFLFFLFS